MNLFSKYHIPDAILCIPIIAALAAAVSSGFTPEELPSILWLLLLVTAVLTVLLTRTRVGIAALFLLGTIIFAGAYFLQFPVPLWGFLLFEFSVFAAYLYRVWLIAAARSETGEARIGGSVLQIIVLCALGLGAAACLYFAAVRPLNPPTRELKLITELKSMELLRVLGVSRTETILDPELRSDALPEDTEQGDQAGEEESDALDDIQETPEPPSPETEPEDDTMNDEEDAEAIDYELSSPSPLWLLLLLPVLISAAYLLRLLQKRRWEKAVQALPPRDAIVNYYRFFLSRLGRAGFPKPAAQTLREYAESFETQLEPLISAEGGFLRLTELYEKALYGRGQLDREEEGLFAETYQDFHAALRREVGTVKYYLTAFRY